MRRTSRPLLTRLVPCEALDGRRRGRRRRGSAGDNDGERGQGRGRGRGRGEIRRGGGGCRHRRPRRCLVDVLVAAVDDDEVASARCIRRGCGIDTPSSRCCRASSAGAWRRARLQSVAVYDDHFELRLTHGPRLDTCTRVCRRCRRSPTTTAHATGWSAPMTPGSAGERARAHRMAVRSVVLGALRRPLHQVDDDHGEWQRSSGDGRSDEGAL